MKKSLTKREIIREKNDIRALFSSGYRLRRGPVSLYCLVTDASHSRVLFTVKQVGGSVKRNRAKRILREVYRDMKHTLGISCDMIIQVKGQLLSFAETSRHLRHLFQTFRSMERKA